MLAPAGSNVQEDFSAGMVRVAPHLIPKNGAYRLTNFLLNDDGSAYKRSGTIAKTDVFDASGLTFCWDGFLAGGHRTVVASAAKLGVLDVDDRTIIDLPGGGILRPRRPAVLHGILFLGGLAYGGSRKIADYNTGTIDTTQFTTTVTGTGTAFAANVDPGMLLVIGDRIVAVQSVTDDTHLELSSPWPDTDLVASAYNATPVAALPGIYHPDAIHVVAGNRLFALEGDRAFFSAIDDPGSWDPTDFHRVPAGVVLTGGIGLQDIVYVFTTGGLFSIQNVAYDLTDALGDAQQRLDQLNEDMILWDAAGLATWENAIVAPCIDGVWLIAPSQPPALLSRSVRPLYQGHVVFGHQAGLAAIYNGHYLLPVLSDTQVEDLLVCRVDRPVRNRDLGTIYPWTQFDGAGSKMRALAVRVSEPDREPELLGAAASGHLVEYGQFVADGQGYDHDHTVPQPDFISRDYATGPGNENHVKKVALRYELTAVAGGAASIIGEYGSDRRPAPPPSTPWDSAAWDSFLWGGDLEEVLAFDPLVGVAPESDGNTPHRWRVNKRLRYLRLRFRCTDPCERLVLRAVELAVRPSGRMW